MKCELRSFTDRGLSEAQEVLQGIRTGELDGVPDELLGDETLTHASGLQLPLFRMEEFSTRWSLAVWLYRGLSNAAGTKAALLEPGHWSWLAMRLFDVIAPNVEGKRRVREDARYLLRADDYRKAYRHLVAGPYLLFQAHSEDPASVRGLLATRPDAPGEVYEQLASRKFLITSRAVVAVATMLYLSPETGELRRGASGAGAGSARRLSEILQQFDKTFDLHDVSPEALIGLLPKEFDRFRR
jgi:hypothetical protein